MCFEAKTIKFAPEPYHVSQGKKVFLPVTKYGLIILTGTKERGSPYNREIQVSIFDCGSETHVKVKTRQREDDVHAKVLTAY